jgi:hypothetical protein
MSRIAVVNFLERYNPMSADRDQGIAALQQGDTATAIAALERATQADPNDFQSVTFLGAAYSKAERHNDSVQALTQAVTIQPSNAQARFNLGVALQKAGWADQAAQAYEQALQLQPNYPQAQQALAGVRPQSPLAQTTPQQPLAGGYPPQQPAQPTYAPQPQSYSPPPQQQAYNPYAANNPAMMQAYQNTSGMDGDVPFEVASCRWNWGAFLLTFLWMLNHGMVGLGILVLLCDIIPFLGLIGFGISIYAGVKGHELAWKKRRFNDLDHYFQVQRKWMYWGIGVFCVLSLLGFIVGMIAVIGGAPR